MKFTDNKAREGEGSPLPTPKPIPKDQKKQVKYFTLAEQKAKSGDLFDKSVEEEDAAAEKQKHKEEESEKKHQ